MKNKDEKKKITVTKWHQSYRVNKLFPNPLNEKARKERIPPFLLEEDICMTLRLFCRNNFSTLAAESAIDYIYDTILPSMITVWGAESETQKSPAACTPTDEEKKEVLKQYSLTYLSILTMHHWLGLLGF